MTAFALFVGLLFGAAPAAHAAPDSRAQLGAPEYVKRAAPVRTTVRTQAEDREADSAVRPPAPAIVTERLCTRPAAAPCSTGWSRGEQTRLTAYRARAPPAV